MDIAKAIRLRKSIRRFKPIPIPREILQDVLETAVRAPSGMNTQPWEIFVIQGKALEALKKANVELLLSGAPARTDIPSITFEGAYRRRQVELAIQLFNLMGIARDDKEKRKDWGQRGYRFFDAPAAIFLCIDSSLENAPTSLLDIGSIMQTICLAAIDKGLGTCIEGQGGMYSDAVRKLTGMSPSKRIATCIAIGYPDWDFPANNVQTPREPLDKVVTWVE